MSARFNTLKGRNTRNSQRLFNLSQQEALYKKLGIAAMPANKTEKTINSSAKNTSPKEKRATDENPVDGEEDVSTHEVSPSDEEAKEKTPVLKKGKAQKRIHSMSSESDSEREKTIAKKKKKKKAALAARKLSNSGSPAFQTTSAQFHQPADGPRPLNFLAGQRGTGDTSPIILPQNLMMSSAESGLISAHMNAYTKFLLENNLLIGQGNSTGFGGVAQNQNPQPGLQQNRFPNLTQQKGQGNNQNISQILQPNPGQPSGSGKGILDDSSIDGSSNVDPLEFLPPPGTQASVSFLPQFLQEPAPAAPGLAPNVIEEVLLSQHCAREKEVDQIDDSAVGPEVPEQIMLMVQNFLGRSRKAAKIDELAQEFLRPKNMPFLKSPQIEEEIYVDLSGQAKHLDKNCRGLQGYKG